MKNQSLRNELIEQDFYTPHLKEKYEKELQTMMNPPLARWKRISFGVSAVVGIAQCILFGYLFFTVTEIPVLARAMFVVGLLFAGLWTLVSFMIMKKRTMNLKKDGGSLVGIIWVFVVFMMTGYLMIGMQMEDAAFGARMILFGMVFLIMGVVFLLQHWIERTELNLKESMLKMELQMAEISEQIKQK